MQLDLIKIEKVPGLTSQIEDFQSSKTSQITAFSIFQEKLKDLSGQI